ncbi:hypothetical protein NDU88_008196 [Pleurodeles waltl]|uniref:Uncharacterized protein n=1 Tax=Pleurodeles waltl TaxID=8319 RepID=A0AAV7VSY6_PLEWA|nr:hypothetical protein NDU88_008196 [Pleurodeles waltl]
MGAPRIGADLQLCPCCIRTAWPLHKYRGAAARLHFQGSRGRASTGMLPALPCLHQDPVGKPASEQLLFGDFDVRELLSSQASTYQPFRMTPKRPSGPGVRTRPPRAEVDPPGGWFGPPSSLCSPISITPFRNGGKK